MSSRRGLYRLFPSQPYVSRSEQWQAAIGAFAGISGLDWITHQIIPDASPWVIGSMGASAVLLFAIPHSPLAQPWAFTGGNLISALIGVACYHWIPDPLIASGAAVSLAILAMFLLQCLHPPGGATALTAVVGGDAIHQLGFQYVLIPVGINVLTLLCLALLLNTVFRRSRSPALSTQHKITTPIGLEPDDLEHAFKAIGSFIDISHQDLAQILELASTHAKQRVHTVTTPLSADSPSPAYAALCRLFSLAFRPFFLLAATAALVSIAAWWLQLQHGLDWPTDIPVRIRHGHEMLFGFSGAAIAGFLLTAVATWTQRPAVSGLRLASLCTFWLTARVGACLPGAAGQTLWAMGSGLFWIGLTVLMAGEVFPVHNTRNYKLLVILALLTACEGLFFLAGPESLAAMDAALRSGLMLITGLILLVGGRIIPNFTLNWLTLHRRQIRPTIPAFGPLDRIANLLFLMFATSFALWPDATATGALGLLAGLAQMVRLGRWKGWLTRREPLLGILHIGYGWIPLGLMLLGLSTLGHPLWRDSGLHALTYGAIGTMILAVTARVALGHTGRPLTAPRRMTLAFWLITAGAALRVFTPVDHHLAMLVSVLLWLIAWILFLLHYTTILLAPRVDAT